MSPILVTLTSRSDSNFERSNISLKENKRDGVDSNSNGFNYCVRKRERTILLFSADCKDIFCALSPTYDTLGFITIYQSINVNIFEPLQCSTFRTSTLWNTIECCRGFQDMKDEISTSLNASDIFGLIFY